MGTRKYLTTVVKPASSFMKNTSQPFFKKNCNFILVDGRYFKNNIIPGLYSVARF
jgi:hypothetical protein